MKVKLSNTGKCITFTLDDDALKILGGQYRRVKLQANAELRTVCLVADPGGRKINTTHQDRGSNSFYLRSEELPDWPLHGLVELTILMNNDDGSIIFRLPKDLPAPAPRKSHTREAGGTRKVESVVRQQSTISTELLPPIGELTKRKANLLFQVKDKTYAFALSDTELLDLALDLSHRGLAA